MTDDTETTGLVVPAPMVNDSGAGSPRLMAGHCEDCGVSAFPAPAQCPRCLNSPLPQRALPTEGVLYSYSVVHIGPPGWPAPYTVGYVDLPGDVRVFGHVAEVDETLLHPDLAVRLRLEPVNGDSYRATWSPCREQEATRA